MFWSDVEKNAKRFRWRKSHSKIETNDEFHEFTLAMQRKDFWCSCLYCIRKPGENQTWTSTTFELMEWAASKNKETCYRRLLSKLLRVECWQELVFSRVEIWWIDQGDLFVNNHPVCSQSTRTNSLRMTRSFLHKVNERVPKIQDNLQKMQHKTTTNTLQYGECLCLRHWKHLFPCQRTTQKF